MHPALHHAFDFLIHHGLAVLFGWVLLEQLGVPIPAMPLLLAAGALAGTGRLNFLAALLFAVLAALASDSLWFQLGATRALRFCRPSVGFPSNRTPACDEHKEFFPSKGRARSWWPSSCLAWDWLRPPWPGFFACASGAFCCLTPLGQCCGPGCFSPWATPSPDRLSRWRHNWLRSADGCWYCSPPRWRPISRTNLSLASAFCANCASPGSPWMS